MKTNECMEATLNIKVKDNPLIFCLIFVMLRLFCMCMCCKKNSGNDIWFLESVESYLLIKYPAVFLFSINIRFKIIFINYNIKYLRNEI